MARPEATLNLAADVPEARPYLCAFTIGVQSYDEVSEKPNLFEN